MPSNEHEEFLTVEELAGLLKVVVGTVYNWVNRREIPFVKVGRAVRFRRSEIDAWIESHRTEPETANDPAA